MMALGLGCTADQVEFIHRHILFRIYMGYIGSFVEAGKVVNF
jgi:hypothetical protein